MRRDQAWWRAIPHFIFLFLTLSQVLAQDAGLEAIPNYSALAEPMLQSYCYDCHSGPDAEAGLSLDQLENGHEFQHDRKQWIEVLRHLRAGSMPPVDMDQPTDEERQELIQWIADMLEQLDCSDRVNPGKATIQRLTRVQYQNTIKDLVGVKFDVNSLFPSDDLAYGFDNNGDVLSVTPVMFDKYLRAANEIARTAIPSAEDISLATEPLKLPEAVGTNNWGKSGRLIFRKASIELSHVVKQSGTHVAKFSVAGMQAGSEPVRMEIRLNDKIAKKVSVYSDKEGSEDYVVLFDANSDEEIKISVAFTNDYYNRELPKGEGKDRNLIVKAVRISGPVDLPKMASKSLQQTLLSHMPTSDQWLHDRGWELATRKGLSEFLPLAYRRPIDALEIDKAVRLIGASRAQGDSYQRSMQIALQAILSSPNFLHLGQTQQRSGPRERINDYELASRLSYFLWGTMPDQELFTVASQQELHTQLDDQVVRMLKDRRSAHLSESFLGQWLEVRQLSEFRPDPKIFPEYDNRLRADLVKEIELLFAYLLMEDQSIFELLDAKFTFLNERLATHYGISGVEGDHFRRVKLPEYILEQGRGGLLGMGSFLMITSNPDRTSPVLRGKYVLANLLGDEPPPPPPNVPALVSQSQEPDGLTLREELDLHRADPACAACHKQMDPIGYALEGFDTLGRVRTSYKNSGKSINVLATLEEGTELDGAQGLKSYLIANKQKFARTLTEKLLTFALGRGLEHYDECAVREILKQTEEKDYRFSALMLAVVNSKPFLYVNHSE